MSNWRESFESLTTQQQNVLYFLAVYAAPVRKIRVQEFLGCLSLPLDPTTNKPFFSKRIILDNTWHINKTKPILEQLEQLGWIDYNSEGLPHCKSDLREQIVAHLYQA